jgi:hypothetical protein
MITADPETWPKSDKLWLLCCACANAEGYQRGPGAVPFDLNNPGDISDGRKTFGSSRHDGSEVTQFPTAEIGWQWLREKWERIVNGRSEVYPASWSFREVAREWAGDSDAWLHNVTQYLGVSADSIPAEYVKIRS